MAVLSLLPLWHWRPPAKLPISPLVGEMSGRTEGGVKELDLRNCGTFRHSNRRKGGGRHLERLAGQRPPLPCRASPPQGG
ncbi:MAG: hypothetical protein EOS45_09820, partial [Mesorhizobium sp.]